MRTAFGRRWPAGSTAVLMALLAGPPSSAPPWPVMSFAGMAVTARTVQVGDPTDPSAPMRLPLDAYSALGDVALVDEATDTLLERCMRERGFHYLRAGARHSRPSLTGDADVPFDRLPYGLVDQGRAKRYGYSNPPVSAVDKHRMITRRASQTPYQRALEGDAAVPSPSEGCRPRAEQELNVRVSATDVNVLEGLISQAHQDAQQDPAMLAANNAWHTCMRRAAYDFDAPDDAASSAWPEVPDRAELMAARQDVSCKQQVGWIATWRRAEAHRQSVAATRNAAVLQRIAAALADRRLRAKSVLGHARASSGGETS